MGPRFLAGSASFALAVLASLAGGCAEEDADARPAEDAFTSNQATLLDFEFDGSLVIDASSNHKKTIEDQLFYTVGHLNQDNAVGRLDNLVLTNIVKTTKDGHVELTYHATLPVAWGAKKKLPKTYAFKIPRDVSADAQEKFASAHKTTCVDPDAHDIDAGNMWFHYRPQREGCTIADAEVITPTATVKRSTQNSKRKFPEYHKIWDDDRLEVISIFGKFEKGGGPFDDGVGAFNQFIRQTKDQLKGKNVVVTPPNLTDAAGPDVMDVTIEATLAGGKQVKVTAFLVDEITHPWKGFDERYESLTPSADLIAYNGHAGLGENVRALARKGKWVASKYQVFFINGCDTFAYVDGTLAQTRAKLNNDDPSGTRFMEFVTNAMPAFFHSMADASSALVNGLLSIDKPLSYDKMFLGIDRAEVVLVTGEEDNEFTPGMPIGKPAAPKP